MAKRFYNDEYLKENSDLVEKIFESFADNSRDVITVPMRGVGGKWFNVCVLGEDLIVTSGSKIPSCNIKGKRKLNLKNALEMFKFYKLRGKTEYNSIDVKKVSVNSSYWYGIFSDLGF